MNNYEYLKIQGTLLIVITDTEAKQLEKKGVFFVENKELEVKIFDIDKTNPMQLAEFLLKGKRKKPFWIYIFIGLIVLLALFFIFKAISGDNKKTPIVQTPIVQSPALQTPIVQSPALQTPLVQTGNINEIEEKQTIVNNGLSQKDLDLAFCQKDNQDLDSYNFELLEENKKINESLKICEDEKKLLVNEIDKTNIYIGIGQQVFNKCKNTTDENIKNNCNNLISNYIYNE